MGMQRGPHKVTSILRQQANAQAVPRERSARVYHFERISLAFSDFRYIATNEELEPLGNESLPA